MESVKIAGEIKTKVAELMDELTTYVEKGRKVSAKRARAATVELTKMFKAFRKSSVADCKTVKQ